MRLVSHDDPTAAQNTSALTVSLGAGVLGAVQPKINAVLGARVGNSMVASLVNFLAAFTVVVVVLALRPSTRQTLRRLRSWPVPRWTLTAGWGGVLAVLSGVLAVETIGVAVFSVAFFAGQITTSLLVDRFGVGGGVQPVAAARVRAAVIAMAAVVASQLGRPVGEFAPELVVLVVAAGGGSAFQAAFNGRIARAVGDPYAPTAVNVTVGLTTLSAIVAALAVMGRVDTLHWPSEPWLYAGGLLGVTIVLSMAVAASVMGVLRTTLAMLAAQLVAALVVDWLVEHEAPTAGVITGAGLIVIAVASIRPTNQRRGHARHREP
jgi:bacterial/archaeal transporter family-2 protein